MKKTRKIALFVLVLMFGASLGAATAFAATEETQPIVPENALDLGYDTETVTVAEIQLDEEGEKGFYAIVTQNDSGASILGESDSSESEKTNNYVRLSQSNGKNYSGFYFTTDVIDANGTYRLSFDIRKNEAYNSANFFCQVIRNTGGWKRTDIFYGTEGVETAIAGEWTEFFIDFNLTDVDTEHYNGILFGLDVSGDASQSVLDLDNIEICKQTVAPTENIGTQNLDAYPTNGGFEEFATTITVDTSWGSCYPFYNLEGTNTLFVSEDGVVLKMMRGATGNTSHVVKATSLATDGTVAAGSYTVKLTIKGGSSFAQNTAITVRGNSNNGSSTVFSDYTFEDTAVSQTAWTTLEHTWTLNSNVAANWVQLAIQCANTDATENNYILIKNIEIVDSNGNSVDTVGGPESVSNLKFESNDWQKAWYIPSGSYSNVSLVESDGDIAMKAIMKNSGSDVSFTKTIGVGSLAAGTYMLKIKVKAGSEFATNNFGYRVYTESDPVIGSLPYSQAKVGEWVTLTSVFKTTSANTGNVDFWIFGAAEASAENYVLLDDIEIVSYSASDAQYGSNLFVDSDKNALGTFEQFFIGTGTVEVKNENYKRFHTFSSDNVPYPETIEVNGSSHKVVTFAQDTPVSSESVPTKNTSFWYEINLPQQGSYALSGTYTVKFDILLEDDCDIYNGALRFVDYSSDSYPATGSVNFAVDTATITSLVVNADGFRTVETDVSVGINESYNGLNMWIFLRSGKAYIKNLSIVHNDGTEKVIHENMSVEGLFKSELVQDGDFEKYDVPYTMQNNQSAQSYWGCLDSYDSPAVIVEQDGGKAARLQYDTTSTKINADLYSSVNVLLDPDEMDSSKVYQLSYDYKLSGDATFNSSFIGSSNEDYFKIDLTGKTKGTYYSEGKDKNVYTYVITDSERGEGWMHVSMLWAPDLAFMFSVNSLRFLLGNVSNEGVVCYIDNVYLSIYETEDEYYERLAKTCTHVDENNDGICDICHSEMPEPVNPDEPANDGGIRWWQIVIIVTIVCAIAAVVLVILKQKGIIFKK